MAAENFKVKKGLEVGTAITATGSGIDVTGIITATQFKGDGSGLTNVVGSGSGVVIKDEGSAVGTAGTINFVGSGVVAAIGGGTATVTISSGGLSDVVGDTTPQLGGNLDLNGKFINGTGGANVVGILTATTFKGNGDFVDIDVDGQTEVDNLNVAGVSTVVGVATFKDSAYVDGQLFVGGIQITGSGGGGSIGTDIVTRNLKATGITTISLLKIGTNNFQIQTLSNTDLIQCSSTSGLQIENSAGITLKQRSHPNWNYASFATGSVQLFHNNQTKLTTTASGITVPDLHATGVGTFATRIDTNGISLGTNNNNFAAKFVDDAVANFGTDNDLKISHDNAHARITNSTGKIIVTGIVSAINAASIQGIDIKAPTSTSVMVGQDAGLNHSGAAQCVGVGYYALRANTNSDFNTAVGTQALGALGSNSGSSYSRNTAIGHGAGLQMTTASSNTLIGAQAGSLINSSGNTILGRFDGNSNGLDIRNSGANVVIANGDGNVRFYVNSSGNAGIGTTNPDAAVDSGNTAKLSVGIVSAHQLYGDGSNITGVTASGSGIVVRHDGNVVGTASSINFAANLDVSAVHAGIVTVTASSSTTGDKIEEGNSKVEVVDTGSSGSYVTVDIDGTETFRISAGRATVDYLRVGSNWDMASTSGTGVVVGNSGNFDYIASSGSSGIDIQSNTSVSIGQNGFPNYDYARFTNSGGEFKTGGTERFRYEASGITVGQKFVSIGATIRVNGEACFAGIVTATTFSGALAASNLTGALPAISGANLTTLNADELDSGTIPNGRFPATLPTSSGANLTSLNADNISSGTLASARIEDEAITFAKMQHVATGVLLGRNDSGTGDIETLSASDVRTLLNVADGATAGITTASSNIALTWDVVNQGASAYRFTGPGQDGSTNNPDIYLIRGNKYRFAVNAGGHPFYIKTSATTGTSNQYTNGVTGNGAQSGNVEFYVPNDAPARLYYICQYHPGMVGNLYILGGSQTGITTTTFTGDVVTGNLSALSVTSTNAVDTSTIRRDGGKLWITAGSGTPTYYAGTPGGARGTHIFKTFAGGYSYDQCLINTSGVNITGVCTATHFYGNGANLTNLDGSAITTGTVAANRVATLNQSTTGNAATATAFSVTSNNTTNETVYPVFVDGNSGTQGAEVDTALSYNPSSNTLTTGTIDIGDANISSGTATISSTGNVDTTAAGSCSAIEYTIYASHSSGIQSQKVLIMDNGSTAYSNEFAVMFSSSLLISFSADLVGAAVRLRGTPESGISGNISIKFIKTIIE